MITIWGRANSSNVQQVMWTIGELGLDHERLDFGGAFGGLDTPDFLAMNPNGKIPTIRDGETILWESSTIVRYLAATRASGGLWLDDPTDRAKAEMWMDWVKTTLVHPLIGVFWQQIRTPSAERDAEAEAADAAETNRLLAILDLWLEGRNFIAGDRLTIGDIPVGTLIYRYFNLDIDRPKLPNVEAWYNRLAARPAYAAHIMLEMT